LSSVENEWLCARIAAAYGLSVANCEIGEFGSQKVLIVERFDRQLHSSGRYWLRLMQEDFAQATGTPWFKKYESDGGPGVLQIAEILRASSEVRRDIQTLFKAQLLSYCWRPPTVTPRISAGSLRVGNSSLPRSMTCCRRGR
jgi:serine/threonine-protein kinase HipA